MENWKVTAVSNEQQFVSRLLHITKKWVCPIKAKLGKLNCNVQRIKAFLNSLTGQVFISYMSASRHGNFNSVFQDNDWTWKIDVCLLRVTDLAVYVTAVLGYKNQGFKDKWHYFQLSPVKSLMALPQFAAMAHTVRKTIKKHTQDHKWNRACAFVCIGFISCRETRLTNWRCLENRKQKFDFLLQKCHL